MLWVGLLWVFWIWVLLEDLGSIAISLAGVYGWLVGFDLGWICSGGGGGGGGFVMDFLDLGFVALGLVGFCSVVVFGGGGSGSGL